MQVTARRNCDLSLVNRAAEMTTHGQPCNAPLKLWLRSEHSPAREIKLWIELRGVETFVSVHFTRHKIGVEHFVQSNRDDRGGQGTEGRLTPVNHGMSVNAQALIQMSRKRLCYKSHKRTVAAMQRIRTAVGEVIPELPQFMVPECVYRNGICPEFTECKPGIEKVMAAYSYYPELFKIRKSHTQPPRERVERDVVFALAHIIAGNDLRDFSDDLDSILAAVDSNKTVGDIVGESVAYWGTGK